MDHLFVSIETALYLPMLLTIISRIGEYKVTRKILLIIDILVIISLFIAISSTDDTIFTVICLFVNVIQILLLYFATPTLRLFSLITYFVFISCSTSIFMVFISGIALNAIGVISYAELIAHIITAALIISFCHNNHLRLKVQNILLLIPKRIKALTLFTMCTSTFLSALLVSNTEMHSSPSWSIVVRISLIFFSLFVCTTFPILIITVLTNTYLKKQNENFERELEAQANHYVAIAESNKELHRFKHDFKNLRIGITKALESGDSGMALSMIENGQKDFIDATESIVKFNTGNGIVDAILNEKQKAANSINTNIVFDGMIPQNIFTPTDLCVIFGNTLDNAIEACEKLPHSQEKTISVSVRCVGGIAFISINNPVEKKVVVNNNTIQTTKKNRAEHGFGLYSLNKIAKKYNGEMSIVSEDKKFTIMLDMYF